MINAFLEYYSYAKARAKFFCNNDELAEDITQNIFLKIHRNTSERNVDDFKTDCHIKAYLTLSVKNELITYKRKHNQYFVDVNEGIYEETIPDKRSIREDASDELNYALSRLKGKDRLSFILHHQYDYSYEEIATIMEIPLGSVRSSIHRAKIEMKESIIEFREKQKICI